MFGAQSDSFFFSVISYEYTSQKVMTSNQRLNFPMHSLIGDFRLAVQVAKNNELPMYDTIMMS